MAPSVDPFYDLYKNKGFVSIEIITSGIIAMICCVAIGLNSSLVYVTIKTTSLHSPCKILLCIGIDRLIGVIFPIWYKAGGKSILNGFNTYIGSSVHWEKPVMCLLGEPNQQPENKYYSNNSALVIYCGEFLCYALIWLIIWRQKSSMPEKVKKLTISLSVFMSIGLLCNILNTIFSNVIMPLLNFDAFTIEYFVLPISLSLQSMAYGSTTPVLYFCNEQYRTAFRRPVAPPVDPFYDLYMNKGFVPIEIITSGIIAMICCVGIGLNSSLVYVTIKTKSLHSPCMILLCIGIDRLIGVIFPIWYKASGKYVTFKCAISICCIRSIINGFSAYIGSSANWEKPVMCLLGEPNQQPENQSYSNISAIVIYCGEFLCYTMILLIMWRRKSMIPENMKKLTISLSVLMSIGLICYILNFFFARVISPLLNLDAFIIWDIFTPISLALQSMAYGSSAPVLYFCNAQYRSAFRAQFGHQATQVTPVQ
uniref:G-protein coupled receptors family 1 profile domain-containing protein n=1 Tax=Globodera rostochiensis TaxID=31243 RepID=A0A914H901_GLORO